MSLFGCVSSPGLAPSCNRGKAAGVLKQEGGDATTRTLTADEQIEHFYFSMVNSDSCHISA